MLAPDRQYVCKCYKMFTFPSPTAARTAGIDMNEEITSLSLYVFYTRSRPFSPASEFMPIQFQALTSA